MGADKTGKDTFQSTPPSREATEPLLTELAAKGFQSTPPSREATFCNVCKTVFDVVSIHAPLTGGDVPASPSPADFDVSIHAPLTGGDGISGYGCWAISTFQSTPPSREATSGTHCEVFDKRVSIHAPLTGGDATRPATNGRLSSFNPRPPHGRRRRSCSGIVFDGGFNPRPPHGRRPGAERHSHDSDGFNPRPPHGRRPGWTYLPAAQVIVSIHAPLTGGDRNILWLKIAPTLDVVLYLPLIGIQFNMRYSLRSHM